MVSVYYLLLRRAADGIHWLPMPVRHMTNLLLTHIGELCCTYIQYVHVVLGMCVCLYEVTDYSEIREMKIL